MVLPDDEDAALGARPASPPDDPTCESLWDRLPMELQETVLAMRRRDDAASLIQSRWFRRDLWWHVRSPHWPRLRTHLTHHGVLWSLSRFSLVRREWRTEAPNWLDADGDTLGCILSEARDGWWGRRTTRLGCPSPSTRAAE